LQESPPRNCGTEATMKINRDNLKYAARMIAIILVAGVADVLAVEFLRRPFPWTAIIPALVPLFTVVFVVMPITRAARS
jgi:hypothetical protein